MADHTKPQDYGYLTFLVGGLAHEIRNPLSTISLNLQLLKEDYANADTQVGRRTFKKLDLIHGEAQRLSEILDNFLRFIRIENLELKAADINALLDEIIAPIEPEVRSHNIEIIKFYDYNLPKCTVDVNFLRQALLNLLINARQAINQNGQIMVRTTHADGMVKIEIMDTGPGISPDNMAKIFKPYFSTKESGAGLGLPTTKRIIDEHGGTIDVRSDLGHGTSFTLALWPEGPRSRQQDQQGEANE